MTGDSQRLRYLTLLSAKYPTVAAASSEIIRMEAVLRLPKGTEHFMSDLHGENEAFIHILNNASGYIRLNLAMPRSILQVGLERIRDAIRQQGRC